jgi:hypothetical protein
VVAVSRADFEKLVRVVPKAGTTYVLRVCLGSAQVGTSRRVTPAEGQGGERSAYVWEALRWDLIRNIAGAILKAATTGSPYPALSTIKVDRWDDPHTREVQLRLRVCAGEEFEANGVICPSNQCESRAPEQEVLRRMAADVANQIVSAFCPLDELREVS